MINESVCVCVCVRVLGLERHLLFLAGAGWPELLWLLDDRLTVNSVSNLITLQPLMSLREEKEWEQILGIKRTNMTKTLHHTDYNQK